MSIVFAVWVAHVQERGLKTGGVALLHGDRQAEHTRRNEGKVWVRVEETKRDDVVLVSDHELMRCAGPAQRKRNESDERKQAGCDHVEWTL